MSELGELALRLSEATDIAKAAERLAEHLRALAPGAAARVYVLGPGDKCDACPRAEQCTVRDRCLHLEAGLGEFGRPVMLDQRIPRRDTLWGRVIEGRADAGAHELPPELTPAGANGTDQVGILMPLEAAGDVVGIAGVRLPAEAAERTKESLRLAAFLGATSIRTLQSLGTANRRYESLLLVNELGRKVNSILNDELLLRQAAVDIHRTFGFHNVMVFMVNEDRSQLELKAQASRFSSPVPTQECVGLGEGVIGRVYQTGQTELIEDVGACDDYVRWFADTRSEMAVPLQIGGVIEGVLNVESDVVAGFTPADRLVLETVANQLAIAIENARLFGMVKEREDRYRTLVESSPGAVLHLDTEGRLIYANPTASEITGYDKRDLLTHFRRLEDLCEEDERETIHQAVSDALRGVARPDLEFTVRHASASPRSVIASLQPLVSEQGDAQGVVVLARDRTRERQLQDQLNQSEKLSAIGTLVSGVAHELNNPLAGILGFAQLLLARPVEDWSRTDVEHIEQSARRCQRIVENLLAFARQSRMTKRRANINEVIDSVLNLNEYQFRMDNVLIERDLDSSVPPFAIDVNRWQQVFINLANNAHQALQDSAVSPRLIRFETRNQGDAVEIRVADNGPGVPEDLRLRIFDPFFTTKETGTGLGLGICFGIVQEHGGSIRLDESHEPGACFVIRLPVAETRVYPVELPKGERAIEQGAGEGLTVLVVDDDTYVCDVVARVLQNHGYTTEVANDGAAALDHLGRTSYDLVVTDVRMPGDYDGIDLHDRLVARDAEAHRRMIYMTGNLLDGRTMERLQQLNVCCIEKPFDIHALAHSVNEVARQAGDTARLTLATEEKAEVP